MKNKVITVRLSEKDLEAIELIKKEAYHIYRPEDITISEVIRLSISYTAELYRT